MIFVGIVLLIIGILYIAAPQKTLAFGRRYLFKDNKEPNVGTLFFTRMMGIFIVILSLYAIIKSLK